jgi:hypothetical protein
MRRVAATRALVQSMDDDDGELIVLTSDMTSFLQDQRHHLVVTATVEESNVSSVSRLATHASSSFQIDDGDDADDHFNHDAEEAFSDEEVEEESIEVPAAKKPRVDPHYPALDLPPQPSPQSSPRLSQPSPSNGVPIGALPVAAGLVPVNDAGPPPSPAPVSQADREDDDDSDVPSSGRSDVGDGSDGYRSPLAPAEEDEDYGHLVDIEVGVLPAAAMVGGAAAAAAGGAAAAGAAHVPLLGETRDALRTRLQDAARENDLPLGNVASVSGN